MPSRISLRKHWISPPLRTHFYRFLKDYTPSGLLSVSADFPVFWLMITKDELAELLRSGMITKDEYNIPIGVNCIREFEYIIIILYGLEQTE